MVFETLTHDYYDGLRFMISARSRRRASALIDGGCFDWLQAQLERQAGLVASGLVRNSRLSIRLGVSRRAVSGANRHPYRSTNPPRRIEDIDVERLFQRDRAMLEIRRNDQDLPACTVSRSPLSQPENAGPPRM